MQKYAILKAGRTMEIGELSFATVAQGYCSRIGLGSWWEVERREGVAVLRRRIDRNGRQGLATLRPVGLSKLLFSWWIGRWDKLGGCGPSCGFLGEALKAEAAPQRSDVYFCLTHLLVKV